MSAVVPPSDGGQAPSTGQPQAGTPATPQAGQGQQPAFTSVEEALKEVQRLQAELHATNQEAAKHRTEKNKIQTELQRFQDAQLSELEKAQKDAARHQQTATELQQKYQELLVRTAIKDKAAALHFHDPEDAFLHLMRGGELDFDDAGNPKNADKLLKALAEAKPYLVQTAEPQAQPGRTSPGATNPSRSAIGAQPVTNPRSLTWNDVLKRPG